MFWIYIDKMHRERIENALLEKGIVPASEIEEQEQVRLFFLATKEELTCVLEPLGLPYTLEEESGEIDWEKQWQEHAPHFEEGVLKIDLAEFGKPGSVEMLPGPGFGDLSHPTTFLTLSLAAPLVEGRIVWDIGCGSGILAIASAKWGAKHIYAVDIDPQALQHTQKNSEHNGVQDLCTIVETPPSLTQSPLVILLNMISSEQEQALGALPKELPHEVTLATSGIPFEERDSYLVQMRRKGWFVSKEMRYQGWMGFLFQRSV